MEARSRGLRRLALAAQHRPDDAVELALDDEDELAVARLVHLPPEIGAEIGAEVGVAAEIEAIRRSEARSGEIAPA